MAHVLAAADDFLLVVSIDGERHARPIDRQHLGMAMTIAPAGVAARCSNSKPTPTDCSPGSKCGNSALKAANSISISMKGEPKTGGPDGS